jgi:hypothetical protein
MLNIFTQTSTPIDPGDCALDHPATRLDLKANLFSLACHNLDRNAKNLG